MSDKKVFSSLDEIVDEGSGIEFAEVEGSKPGQIVRIGSLDAGTILEFIEANEDPNNKKIAGLRLLRKSLVNENGERLATDDEEADLKKIKRFDQRFANKIVEAVMKLNGLSKEEQKTEETTLKNV